MCKLINEPDSWRSRFHSMPRAETPDALSLRKSRERSSELLSAKSRGRRRMLRGKWLAATRALSPRSRQRPLFLRVYQVLNSSSCAPFALLGVQFLTKPTYRDAMHLWEHRPRWTMTCILGFILVFLMLLPRRCRAAIDQSPSSSACSQDPNLHLSIIQT